MSILQAEAARQQQQQVTADSATEGMDAVPAESADALDELGGGLLDEDDWRELDNAVASARLAEEE